MNDVSVVIPTIGRRSLSAAIESAMNQTQPPLEIIIVADRGSLPEVPSDRSVKIIAAGGLGPSRARQIGIESAKGEIIALLDDDDCWFPTKLEVQLASVRTSTSNRWIASCRVQVTKTGAPRAVWPDRLILGSESVGEYLFRSRAIGFGHASIPTSTLMFPRRLALRHPWDAGPSAVHDDPGWLIKVQKAVPNLKIVQSPHILVRYEVGGESVSRDSADRTEDYIRWGREHLSAESARTRADYFLTSPVSAATSAVSIRGFVNAIRAAVQTGLPGPWALAFALLSGGRILVLRIRRDSLGRR